MKLSQSTSKRFLRLIIFYSMVSCLGISFVYALIGQNNTLAQEKCNLSRIHTLTEINTFIGPIKRCVSTVQHQGPSQFYKP